MECDITQSLWHSPTVQWPSSLRKLCTSLATQLVPEGIPLPPVQDLFALSSSPLCRSGTTSRRTLDRMCCTAKACRKIPGALRILVQTIARTIHEPRRGPRLGGCGDMHGHTLETAHRTAGPGQRYGARTARPAALALRLHWHTLLEPLSRGFFSSPSPRILSREHPARRGDWAPFLIQDSMVEPRPETPLQILSPRQHDVLQSGLQRARLALPQLLLR